MNYCLQLFPPKVYTADAKLGFDDNASFRQKAIFDMEDTTESDPREVDAASHNLNYVQVRLLLNVVIEVEIFDRCTLTLL